MDLRLRHEEPLISLYYMSLSILEIWGFCVRSHNHLHHNNHTYEICINMNLVHWKRHVLLCNFGRTSLSHKVLTLVLKKEKKLYALQVLSASSWRISNQGSGAIALIVGEETLQTLVVLPAFSAILEMTRERELFCSLSSSFSSLKALRVATWYRNLVHILIQIRLIVSV